VQEFGVARNTIRKATRALREEGLIVTVPQLGSFVAEEASTEGPNPEEELGGA
jgi:DNA-binding GntR family transcriptional regulator